MAGQPGQPQYGSGWPDGLLAGLGQPGHREARPLDDYRISEVHLQHFDS